MKCMELEEEPPEEEQWFCPDCKKANDKKKK